MNKFDSISSFAVLFVAMTALDVHGTPPGGTGFLIDINAVKDFFTAAGLPSGSGADWLTKMAIEARGIFIAKIYVLARLDGINPDNFAQAKAFEEWLENVLPSKTVLALYGFGGNTVGDLVASILLAHVHKVSVEIYVNEPEYTASNNIYSAGDVVLDIFNLIITQSSLSTISGVLKIQILNPDAVGNYKTLPAPGANDPLANAKNSYSSAVNAIPQPRLDASVAEIQAYIAFGTTNLSGEINAILACPEFNNGKLLAKQAEQDVINKINSKGKNGKTYYAMVTEAFNGASSVLGDFKLSSVATLRIAFAAQSIISPSGDNILVTNDNPAVAYAWLGTGLPWMYAACGLDPNGLQPSFNVNMGPLKKQVLFSANYRQIKHISIMPDVAETYASSIADWLHGSKIWKYDVNGLVKPDVPGMGKGATIDLSHSVKLIKVSQPNANITTTFTRAGNVATFIRETTALASNFNALAVINGVC